MEDLGQIHTGFLTSVSPFDSWSLDSVGYVLMEYYSTVKKNAVMKFSGKWMKLGGKIILNVVTETQKDKHDIYSHIS